MAITAEQVKELRGETGAGFLECRKALEEAGGDFTKAIGILREKGLAKAAKRADRITLEGVLELYSHGNGRVGVMVEVNCETDFVARSSEFRNFAHELALQIAAAAPKYIRPEEIPADVLEREREDAASHARAEGKPAELAERIGEGRIEKYKAEVCLLLQPYIRDEKITIQDVLNEKVVAIGENIVIRRFMRWEVGENSAG
jgi:elongation factor Ts